jgi:hypothetical protein
MPTHSTLRGADVQLEAAGLPVGQPEQEDSMKKLALVVGILASVTLSAGPVSAQTGDQRFTVIISGRGEDAPGISRVVASGPIRGVGTFEFDETNEDFVRFVFPDGSTTLDAPNTEETEDFNERTCSASFTFSGTFKIIAGTGAYEDATGSGTFAGKGRFIGQRNPDGSCSEEDGFFFVVVKVKGTVDLHGQAAA